MSEGIDSIIETENLARRSRRLTGLDGQSLIAQSGETSGLVAPEATAETINGRSIARLGGNRFLCRVVFLLLPVVLALALYWPTLSQPYFWDDLPRFQWATERSWLQIWTSVIGLSYFRPVTFTLYKLLFGALPPGVTTPAHLLMLLLHVASGWLVGVLTCRFVLNAAGDLSGVGWS